MICFNMKRSSEEKHWNENENKKSGLFQRRKKSLPTLRVNNIDTGYAMLHNTRS
jgi:hypothetical protein